MNSELMTPRPNGFTPGHLQFVRPHHWLKLVVVLSGVVAALALNHVPLSAKLIAESTLGLLAIAIIASSNYVLDEIMDTPYDSFHPLKRNRPVPRGYPSVGAARHWSIALQWMEAVIW